MPAELRDAAWIAGNGEPAWPIERALEAARWLADHRLAIAGGEVYEQLPETQWGTFSEEWSAAPAVSRGQPWTDFVEETFEQASRVINASSARGRSMKVYFVVFASSHQSAP